MKLAYAGFIGWLLFLAIAVVNVFFPLGRFVTFFAALQPGDWGTWLSGIGSLVAALVAVGIASYSDRQQRRAAKDALGFFIDAVATTAAAIRGDARLDEWMDSAPARQLEIRVLVEYGQRIEVGRLGSREALFAIRTLQNLAHIDSFLEGAKSQRMSRALRSKFDETHNSFKTRGVELGWLHVNKDG